MASDDRFAAWVPEALKGDSLFEPSSGALRQAIALGSGLEGRENSWFALLSFDSAALPAPAGVRHSTALDRRLLFRLHEPRAEAAEHQLDLHLRRLPDRGVEVTGQLLPPLPGAVVHTAAGRRRRRQPVGEAGDFLIRNAAGADRPIELWIETADGQEIRLAALSLDPDAPPES